MFSVIVVDDEPAAVDYICTIIETKCHKFQVVATAQNAEEGLEKVRKYQPDLVITDIKMPIMNGIDFVAKLKKESPSIYSIIVSGYQDFEYAKGAIRSGALDYILKPFNPAMLKNTMDNIVDKLNSTLSQKRNHLIRSISRGGFRAESEIKKCFPSERYYAAIIRKNGLPRRFSTNSNLEIFSNEDEMIYLYGRDEMESLYICPEEILYPNRFAELIRKVLDKSQYQDGYTTSVIVTKSFRTKELFHTVKELYRTLDSRIVIGYTQSIYLDKESGTDQVSSASRENISQAEYIMKEQKWDLIKKELAKLMLKWKKEKRPQLWVERYIRQIFYSIQSRNSAASMDDYEFMLEDAFFYAASMEELTENVLDIFYKCLQEEASCWIKIDTVKFMELIKEYLNRHISESITLQSVCKEFGISQPYLSKLFRKYEDKSFNNYITTVRIDCAKKLMQENRDFFIKDIAAMVGYNDQFYFSRVFCSVTGTPPSVYAEMLDMEKG